MKACGLSVILSYQADVHLIGRLKTISTDIKERISTMGNLFVVEGLVRPYVVATDTALLKSKGHSMACIINERRCSSMFRN